MGVRRAVLCIDRCADGLLSGRLSGEGIGGVMPFADVHTAALSLERACEAEKSPFPSVARRHFFADADGMRDDGKRHAAAWPACQKGDAMEKVEANGIRGELGSFLVLIQHRQNGSWQGRVTWMEQNRTVQFRSVWELVQLVDEAVRNGQAPEISWDSDNTSLT